MHRQHRTDARRRGVTRPSARPSGRAPGARSHTDRRHGGSRPARRAGSRQSPVAMDSNEPARARLYPSTARYPPTTARYSGVAPVNPSPIGRSRTTAPSGMAPSRTGRGTAIVLSANQPSVTTSNASSTSTVRAWRRYRCNTATAPKPASMASESTAGSHARAGTRVLFTPGNSINRRYGPNTRARHGVDHSGSGPSAINHNVTTAAA